MTSADTLVRLSREIRTQYTDGNFASKEAACQHFKEIAKFDPITKTYPAMLPIICSSNYDRERLEYMIRLSARVQSGEIDEKVASVAVGQRLVDEIVKPQIDKNKK